MLRRTFKYRLYPTRKQERAPLKQLLATQEIYNACLEQRIILYREHGISIGYLAQSKQFTQLRNDYDLIYVEDLNIEGLAGSTLAKDVRDQAWAQFTSILTDKAEEAGRTIVLVDPSNTSQYCSGCGHLPEMRKPLSQRTHECGECGLTLDRDVNAARNVLRLGESQRAKTARGVRLARAA